MLENRKIGFAVTSSFCTVEYVFPEIMRLRSEGADVIPIVSENLAKTNTRFGTAADILCKMAEYTGHEPLKELTAVEPIGPQKMLDALVVAPCTGNTLAKISNGITDTTVAMAVKAHMRNARPVILAIATNDGLGANARNIGLLLNTKNIFFVPFGQDDPKKKCNSLIARFSLVLPTLMEALNGNQIQPLLI